MDIRNLPRSYKIYQANAMPSKSDAGFQFDSIEDSIEAFSECASGGLIVPKTSGLKTGQSCASC